MNNSSVNIQQLRTKASSKIKTAQLQQAVARLEATLSRTESQKVAEKSKNIVL